MANFQKTGCPKVLRLSKSTFLAMLPEESKPFYQNMDNSIWSIASFDPKARNVCIDVVSKGQIKVLAATLKNLR